MEWIEAHLLRGHGVASGQSESSPYPGGTIALQRPSFARLGLDLGDCFAGTLNLSVAPLEWRLEDPDHRFERLRWTALHPPETFCFWRIQVKRLVPGDGPASPVEGSLSPAAVAGWIYWPDPSTKRRHFQPPQVVEVLAPPLGAVTPGERFALGVDPRRITCIDGVRLRSRLLEFFKFRVLAAQAEFFADWRSASDASIDPQRLRQWLTVQWPEALALADTDLLATCQKAWELYGP